MLKRKCITSLYMCSMHTLISFGLIYARYSECMRRPREILFYQTIDTLWES